MRLDELRDATDEAADNGAPAEYAVQVTLDGISFHIDRVEVDPDGTFRIYLET